MSNVQFSLPPYTTTTQNFTSDANDNKKKTKKGGGGEGNIQKGKRQRSDVGVGVYGCQRTGAAIPFSLSLFSLFSLFSVVVVVVMDWKIKFLHIFFQGFLDIRGQP